MTPRLGTSASKTDKASVGATPPPSPSCNVRGTPTKAIPSKFAAFSAVSLVRRAGSSRNDVTWVHSPREPGSSGRISDQYSKTSILGFISMGRSSSSSIIPGIMMWPISTPVCCDNVRTLIASSMAYCAPRSTFGGTSSSATVLSGTNDTLLTLAAW